MKLIKDEGTKKTYLLPANAVYLVIDVASRQTDVICADDDEYQVEIDGRWCKVKEKRKFKRDGSEWSGIEKISPKDSV
jgi:hypothetical protein